MDIESVARKVIQSLWENIMRRMRPVTLVKCKYCDSADVVKFGTFKGVQRWWCKDCQRKFIDSDTLYKMKTPITQIGGALSMYYRGMSLDDIGEHLEQQYGNKLTDAGIYNWIKRFTKNAVKEAKAYKPSVGDVWIADETALNIGGSHKVWFWDIIDAKTRFLLASHISTKRTTADALKLMGLAEARVGKTPELVFTDKLQAYTDGIELAFGADTKHIPSKGFVAPMNTNIIERFHGTLKDRTKVMRGFKNIKTAKLLLDGWLVHYNFFRPHESLKDRTPAEVAGIKFVYKDWADVVRGKKPKEVIQAVEEDKAIETIRASPTPAPYRPKSVRRTRKVKPKKLRQKREIMPTSVKVMQIRT